MSFQAIPVEVKFNIRYSLDIVGSKSLVSILPNLKEDLIAFKQQIIKATSNSVNIVKEDITIDITSINLDIRRFSPNTLTFNEYLEFQKLIKTMAFDI